MRCDTLSRKVKNPFGEKIYPTLVYKCPKTGEYFGNGVHCVDCNYLLGFDRDRWWGSVTFDVVRCKYLSLEDAMIYKGDETL